MALPDLDITLELQKLQCLMQGESGSDEPYIMTVFFKIDGDTTKLDLSSLKLAGTATVQATASGQGDLGRDSVRAGDIVAIPPAVGLYKTVLKPIPVIPPIPALLEQVPPMMGYVMLLWEEDNTPADLVRTAYAALKDALQAELDGLIPQLGVEKREPSDDDMKAMQDRIENSVKDKVGKSNIFDLFLRALDPDDGIGQDIRTFKYIDLFNYSTMAWNDYWLKEGEWTLDGRITALKMFDFIPDIDTGPLRLQPASPANQNAWIGAWYGTPEQKGREASGLYVRIDPAPGGLNVLAVDGTGLAPVITQIQEVSPSPGYVPAYSQDIWTFVDLVAQAPPSPRLPVFVHAPSSKVDRDAVALRNPGTKAHPDRIIRFTLDTTDCIDLPRNARLCLYAMVNASGVAEQYRVRYIRADKSKTQLDVMLAPKPPG